MTKEDWFREANASRDKLKSLIDNYHPVNITRSIGMRITARNAEAACEVVRNNIKRNFEGNPVTEFQDALDVQDINKAMKLLNDAWFGVPESTDCWQIYGFKEAVDLLDDPPDDVDNMQTNY